ncbi:MAG: DUF2281 domain-containing protein [Rhodocyclaceae bacterium]|nr:DUF2281 domain-containing protein [Rhodocyclaceae bacterium]
MTTADLIYEHAKQLPPQAAQEVLDFIEFLAAKHGEAEARNLMLAQQASLSSVWDNDADEAWNDADRG